MNNVIGYKGTPESRMNTWTSMRMLKDYTIYGNNPIYSKIKEQDKRLYKIFINNYVNNA